MQSTIFDDLKRYNGPIQGVKIANELSDEERPKRGRKPQAKTDLIQIIADAEAGIVVEKPTKSKIDIESIAQMVKPPFVACRADGEVIHDTSCITVKCEFGHAHKYFIKDVSGAGVTKCVTCGNGNKFTTMVRKLAESLLDVPFVAEYTRGNPIEFYNAELRIRFWCGRTSGNNKKEVIDNILWIRLYPTTQEKKVRDSVCQFLSGWPYLSKEQQQKIFPALLKIADANFVKEPLVYNAELAATPISASNIGTMFGEAQIPISSDQSLCLENCGYSQK